MISHADIGRGGNGGILVLDVGKTNTKLSLWTARGERLGAVSRLNADVEAGGYRALDTAAVQAWLTDALKTFASKADIRAIVPIAHGAAAAVVAGGKLAAPPMSYETPIPRHDAYESARDAFAATGSPRLPGGLNLGAQLHHLENVLPAIWQGDACIVTYPQYWAWLLSGVAACEVSSLGCHSDLWRPSEPRFSDLAKHFGWADRFAPLRRANDVLGPITAEWADKTGISRDCVVYCGAHDSNAAFYGARAHAALSVRDVTIVSTGTWFVAMRAPKHDAPADLDAGRDTLLNVGVDGALIPSARFMGGREMEVLIGAEDTPMRTPEFARNVAPPYMHDVLAHGLMALPSFAPGVGPFPDAEGGWQGAEPQGPSRRAAAGMYLALVADTSLDLIGTRDAIVVEGRFADDLSFLSMLAALRPDDAVYAARAEDGLAWGALRLVNPELAPQTALARVEPVKTDVWAYAARWRELVRARATQATAPRSE